MRRLFKIAVSVSLFALALACTPKKAPEVWLPADDVVFSGNGFQLFTAGGDVKIFTVQGNDKLWTVKASIPLTKADKTKITTLAMEADLMDENSAPVHGSSRLIATALEEIIPVFNASENASKTIIFACEEPLAEKDVRNILGQTKSLSIAVTTDSKAAAPTAQSITLSSLLQDYGCWGLFAEYDRACRNDDEDRQDRIEDRLDNIVKKVKNDPNVSEKLADRFEDYIDDKLDQIEDKY